MRVAAVDCGTNATRLLVADVTTSGVHEITRRLVITRMGQRMERDGVIGADALRRVRQTLRSYAGIANELGAERIGVLATSAARDAVNSADLLQLADDVLGVTPAILTGEQEAAATHGGALSGLPAPAPALVVDLGGGSTEFAINLDGTLHTASLNVGSVRLTERVLHDDPPPPRQVAEAVTITDEALDDLSSRWPLEHASSLVAVGGTALTLVALQRGIDDPDHRTLHGARLTAAQVSQLTENLIFTPNAHIADLAAVTPGREDVIGAGALILSRVLSVAGTSAMTVSRHDLLDDLARRIGQPEHAAGADLRRGP